MPPNGKPFPNGKFGLHIPTEQLQVCGCHLLLLNIESCFIFHRIYFDYVISPFKMSRIVKFSKKEFSERELHTLFSCLGFQRHRTNEIPDYHANLTPQDCGNLYARYPMTFEGPGWDAKFSFLHKINQSSSAEMRVSASGKTSDMAAKLRK